jgi:TRAP-type C4-dicarboxylate transport system permease small subunit
MRFAMHSDTDRISKRDGATAAAVEDGSRPLLVEESICAGLLGGMVMLMFTQAAIRNCTVLSRTALGCWLAHATEVLPSGLTWLTFLACAAVTRRGDLLRVDLIRGRLRPKARRCLDAFVWILWGLFFGVLLVLGTLATVAQRKQMTSISWLPAWAVALSIPLGACLVIWRTVQNLVELWRHTGTDRGSPDSAREGRAAPADEKGEG